MLVFYERDSLHFHLMLLLFQSSGLCVQSPSIIPFPGCCQAHLGLPVVFLLLRYLVLFTVESLSLLDLLFYILIYMFYEMMH